MDEIDTKILKLLKRNSRMSFIELGREVGLSEGAVRRRVKKMVKDGTIQRFTIEIKGEREAIVLIKTDPAKTSYVTERVREIAGKAFEVSGDFDVAVYITAPSIEEVNRMVDKIRNLPYVLETNTLIKMFE